MKWIKWLLRFLGITSKRQEENQPEAFEKEKEEGVAIQSGEWSAVGWANYDGSNNSSLTQLATFQADMLAVCAPSSTRSVAITRDMTPGSETTKVLLINNTSGALVDTLDLSERCYWVDVIALDSSRAAIIYEDVSNTDMRTAVITFSGDTLASGTAVSVHPGSPSIPAVGASMARINDTNYVVAYADPNDSGHGKLLHCSVSGSTVTANTSNITEFAATQVGVTDIECVRDTQVCVAYTDVNDRNQLNARAATVDTSDGSAVFGTAIVVDAAKSGADLGCMYPNLARVTPNGALAIVWQDLDDTATHATWSVTSGGKPKTKWLFVDTADTIMQSAETTIADRHYVNISVAGITEYEQALVFMSDCEDITVGGNSDLYIVRYKNKVGEVMGNASFGFRSNAIASCVIARDEIMTVVADLSEMSETDRFRPKSKIVRR